MLIQISAYSSALPQLDDDEMDEAFSEDAGHIAHTLSQCGTSAKSLPTVNVNEPNNPFDTLDPSNIDLSHLIQMRFLHQTKQATTGVRTTKTRPPGLPSDGLEPKAKELTERQKILKGFANIIREQGEKGIESGVGRALRWTQRNSVPGQQGETNMIMMAGNSANAAAVADATAKRVRLVIQSFLLHIPTKPLLVRL